MDIEIRKATPKDAAFIAWAVLTALDIPDDEMPEVTHICEDDHTLYSWRNSFIAVVDGKVAGALVAYGGERYVEMRDYTWIRMWPGITREKIESSPVETHAGEYYIDSLAVLPEYRGLDIGKRLLRRAVDYGHSLGYSQFRLLCDVRKPTLRRYYISAGFMPDGTMMFMGHLFDILTLKYGQMGLDSCGAECGE